MKKHMNRSCIPKIQQSKRRQALMAASVQDEAEVLFEGEISQRNGDILLDCEECLWDTASQEKDKTQFTAWLDGKIIYYDEVSEMNWESFKDIGTSNIDIGDEE